MACSPPAEERQPADVSGELAAAGPCSRGAMHGFPSAPAPRGLVPHLRLALLSPLPGHSFCHLADLSFRENLIHMVWGFCSFKFFLCTLYKIEMSLESFKISPLLPMGSLLFATFTGTLEQRTVGFGWVQSWGFCHTLCLPLR